MLEIQGLSKTFGGKPALENVSFNVAKGEIHGLLGHNGAGKSTTLGIILGMVMPDAGNVTIGGASVLTHRSTALCKAGAIFESPAFFDYLSGWNNLKILMSYSGGFDEKSARETVEMVGLTKRIHSKVRTYSHGMRQRLALAQALLPEPELLLLDEPTDGLDPEGIREFREFILKLRDDFGMTILLNSHLLAEIELMCDRCVILKAGRKVYEGPVPSRSGATPRYLLATPDTEIARTVASRAGVTFDADGSVELPPDILGHEFLRRLVEAGVRVESWQVQKKNLEDCYLELTSAPA